MKKYALLFIFVSNVFASECINVDKALRMFEIGYLSQVDVAHSISCNLEGIANSRSFCNTVAGLKKDIAIVKEREYNVSLITLEELEAAKEEARIAAQKCK